MTVPVLDRGPQIQGVAILFLTLSTIAVSLRCYCRAVLVKSFGLDDWSAVTAWLFFVFFCTFEITGCHHGTGQHVSAIPLAEIPVGLKWWWACEPVYVLSNMALKFSIGIFLLRIAVAKVHRIIIWTAVAVIEIYSAFFFLLFVLQCRPSAYFWTQYAGGKGTCINPTITVDATYVYSAISCACDWTLGIIPVFLVWNLQMNPRTKLMVALILAVGAVASTATIIRIPYVKGLANVSDFLYATSDVAIWSTAETGIGITASCVATLRPMFRTFFSRNHLMGDTSSQGGSSTWPKSNGPSSHGYIRSRNHGGVEVFGLRNDIGKTNTVTTIIESDPRERDLERGEKAAGSSKVRAEPVGPLARPTGWNNSESKLTEVSSDEEEARPSWTQGGIMKTTVATQSRS